MLFGKTLTRLIVQTFSMDQYEQCPDGWIDDGFFCRQMICPDEKPERDGLLCYPDCKSGFNGQGPVCWANCPESGSGCKKYLPFFAKWSYPKTTIPKASCPKGWTKLGVGAASWCDNSRIWPLRIQTKGATLSCTNSGDYKNSNGKISAGLCHHECKDGFVSDFIGAVCYQRCPPNTTNTGATCNKNSYGRGAGVFPFTRIKAKKRIVDYSKK